MLGAQLFISRTKTIKNSDHTDFCRKKLKTSKYKVRHSFSTPETGPRGLSHSQRKREARYHGQQGIHERWEVWEV